MECVRSMLSSAKLPNIFWAEAVSTTVYLQNRLLTSALKNKTPEEVWSGRKPSVAHLRVFGSKAYSHIPKEKRKKLDSKTLECILIGYNENVKGYRLYNLNTKSVIISRNVAFNEDTQDQEGAQPPANDTFIDLQPLLLDEDQTLKQGGQNPQHGQLQQNAPNIGVVPPQAPIVNQDSDSDSSEYYNSETEFSDPEEVPHR